MARKKAKTLRTENDATETVHALTEQIASLAHALWRERGCPHGSPEEDWFKAEQEVKQRRKGELLALLHDVRTSS